MNNKSVIFTRIETRKVILKSNTYNDSNNNVIDILFSNRILSDKDSPFIYFSYSYNNLEDLISLLNHNTFNFIHTAHINFCTLSRYNYKKISNFINKNKQTLKFDFSSRALYVADQISHCCDEDCFSDVEKFGTDFNYRNTTKYLYSFEIDFNMCLNKGLKLSYFRSVRFNKFLIDLNNYIQKINRQHEKKAYLHEYAPCFLYDFFQIITIPEENFYINLPQNNRFMYRNFQLIQESESFKKFLSAHSNYFDDICKMVSNSVLLLDKIDNIENRINKNNEYTIIHNIHTYINKFKDIKKNIINNIIYIYEENGKRNPDHDYPISFVIKIKVIYNFKKKLDYEKVQS